MTTVTKFYGSKHNLLLRNKHNENNRTNKQHHNDAEGTNQTLIQPFDHAERFAHAVHHGMRCGFAGLGGLKWSFGRHGKLITSPAAISRFSNWTSVSKRTSARYICSSVDARLWIVRTGPGLFKYREQRRSRYRVVAETTSVATILIAITRALAANVERVENRRKPAASGVAGNRCGRSGSWSWDLF